MQRKEYEKTLYDYIAIIIKRRYLILGILFATVIPTTLITFLLPKTYNTTASVLATPVSDRDPPSSLISDKSLVTRLNSSMELFKSNIILERVISELGLTDKEENRLRPDEFLANHLNIYLMPNTHIIKLEASHDNPEMAKKIANTWIQQYIEYDCERQLKSFEYEIRQKNDLLKNLKEEIAKHEKEIINTEEGKAILNPTYGMLEKHIVNTEVELTKLRFRSTKIGDTETIKYSAIQTISPAIEPRYATWPKKQRIIAIAAIASLVFSILLANFMEDYQRHKA